MLPTASFTLQTWQERHRVSFSDLHADTIVMADQGGPIDRRASDAKFDRYRASLKQYGVSRWAVETSDGCFIGYSGVMFRPQTDHPLGPHYEIGWRFMQHAWGRGFATRSAATALNAAFQALPITEILSYTSNDNSRSQAVMRRLGLRRDPPRDFTTVHEGVGHWKGLVWVAAAGFNKDC